MSGPTDDEKVEQGKRLFKAGKLAEARSDARAAMRKRMEANWGSFEELCRVGRVLLDLDMAEEALEVFGRCAELRPDDLTGLEGMGSARLQMGELDEAIQRYDDVLCMAPDYPPAHCSKGWALLLQGDYARGFAEKEWRWRSPSMQRRRQAIGKPMWTGEELKGRSILLLGEVGLGETIQFSRYIPWVAKCGGKVIVSCQAEILSLLRNFAGIEHLVGPGEPTPPFDLFCGMVSLPAVFGTTLETIPPPGGPLAIDPAAVEKWKTRLADDGRRKVGLVWSGKERTTVPQRSVLLAELASLAQEKVRLISLQKGEAAGQIAAAGMPIEDWTAELNDFADTAALMQNLDLIVSVDTSVAHLAGAIGKPVWVLLKYCPDWRWMMRGSQTAWYPTMRLFRQQRNGDWTTPISEAAEALGRL